MNSHHARCCLKICIAALVWAISLPALAVDAPDAGAASPKGSVPVIAPGTDSADADPDADPARRGAAEQEARKLETITVTAERREQDLQKYAGTAQVVTQDDLRGLGINNELRNIQVLIPGLSIANQEGNVEIFLRGVGSANNTELGDPAAAPYLNGNYIARPRGLGMMFYDLENVEISKGPQGTLRGRNALAGSMNIVTKKPEIGTYGGYVQAEYGNRDSKGGEAAINIPIGEVSALRVSGYSIDKDSSFHNAGAAQSLRPAGIQEETAGRISFLSKPNDWLSIFVMGDYGHEGGTGYPGSNIYTAAKAGFSPEELDLRDVIYRGPEGKLDDTIYGFQTVIDFKLDKFKIQYNGSYRNVDFNQRNASSDGILYPGRDVSAAGEDYDVFSSVYWQTRSQAQTHELLLSSPDDARFRWTTGAFYFHEKQQSGFFSLVDKGYCCYSGTEFTMPHVDGKSWAGFADGTFDLSDHFRIKGGFRYTDESKFREGIGGNWALVQGGDGFSCCFATRLGTEGFDPALLDRPNFDVSNLHGNADLARFLLEGALHFGARDTMPTQLGGVVDGSRPNGTCIQRADINNGSQVCPANGQFSFLNLTIPALQRGSSSDNFSDWRIGMEYDVSTNSLFYATLSTGHKAGGFNDSFNPDVVPETYKPESIIALEVGSKNKFEFYGAPATFNVSGFYYKYTDQVFQDLTTIAVDGTGAASGYSLVSRNIGKSRLFGLEVESSLLLPHEFLVTFNGLYLNTRITEGTVGDARSQNFGAGGITSRLDLTGNELPLASKYTINARVQQFFEFSGGSFDWQALFAYRSGFFLTQYNDRDVVFISDVQGTIDHTETALQAGFPDFQRGRLTINAGMGFTGASGKWRLESWISNLLNKDVSQKALVGSGINVRFLNDARSYGIRFRYIF